MKNGLKRKKLEQIQNLVNHLVMILQQDFNY